MRIERLGELGSAPAVLRAVADGASRRGLPPPAALIGELVRLARRSSRRRWPCRRRVDEVFAVPPGASDAGAVGGGWFGYLSYPDAGADGRGPRIPEAAGGWSDCVLRQDRDGQWWYESLSGAPLSTWVTEALRSSAPPRTSTSPGAKPTATRTAAGCWTAWRPSRRARSTRRVCARSSPAGSTARPIDFFVDAVTRTAPARAAYLAGDWGAVASLSPELFLRRCGEAVTSSPIKGTLPRHAQPSALRASVKDVAENIMIVDLVRNDLGRVAVTGTVTVPELLAVRPAPGVWHLVSTVTARVGVDVPMAAVLDATFPPASVTGTPKTRARQLLRSWEPTSPRSVLRHSRFGVTGRGHVSSTSRSAPWSSTMRVARCWVSAAASPRTPIPMREWEECLHKAAPIVGLSSPRPHDGVVQLTP